MDSPVHGWARIRADRTRVKRSAAGGLIGHNGRMMIALLALLAAGPEAGPAIGQPLPAFALPDQEGRVQTFASLRGPQGFVLVFFRSADW